MSLTWQEQIGFWLYVAMLPIAVVFIWRFSRDRWWRSWFGCSLMAIAVALMLAGVSVVLFRLFGPYYPGRNFVVIVTPALAFFAILTRTIVLIRAQRADKRSRARSEHRH